MEVPETKQVRVWDSTAEIRYLVIPQRPAGSENMSEEQLARSSRAIPWWARVSPAAGSLSHELNSRHGGMHGFGPLPIEANEPVFHHDWEAKAMALRMAMGSWANGTSMQAGMPTSVCPRSNI